ncbi:Cytochrome P450 [Macleaya cordata]|uniref:Cytochrome P450 n=1 Tax=Macleaya cordata TaxID=56857 RepID=A0A200QMV0_MACCD|nr:Cytochrome P450 [Macleaya cordata]
MVPAMIEAADSMLDKWKKEEGKEIEVFEEFRLLTSEIISRAAFGSSYVEGKTIFDMLMKFGGIVHMSALKTRIPIIGKFMPNREDIESVKCENEIRRKILEIIEEREEKVKKGVKDGYGNDYLALLLKANQDPNVSKQISIQDMIDDCKTFYFAGQDTTTTLLSWTCLLLATHQDWQEKARKEVFEVIGNNNPTPDDGTNPKLKTLTMIINETLRLYPPVLLVTRKAAREVRLGELTIPANVELRISPTAIHHDPDLWGEDVHIFKPERFSEGVVKATNNNPSAYIPFGFGPRICVGFNFAYTEVKLVVAMILQRYHFTISSAYVHSPAIHLSTRPQHGLQIIFNKL